MEAKPQAMGNSGRVDPHKPEAQANNRGLISFAGASGLYKVVADGLENPSYGDGINTRADARGLVRGWVGP